jgi:hypothetical protein
MSILAVQLNHPGREKPFKLGNGYSQYQGQIIREWNSDPSHYRKFLQQKGCYILKPGEELLTDDLLFWGEWEGNSWFQPLTTHSPNGIHRPFHSLHIRGHQNTDPYVYGDRFHYAVCKQRGRLTQLDPGSLILFGSSFKSDFVLDTVFVVGSFEIVHEVAANRAVNYSKTYRESTIEQLGEIYVNPENASNLRLYSGKMYARYKDYFSYVPCRPLRVETNPAFGRVMFPYDYPALNFSSNPTGIKILTEGEREVKAIWEAVTSKVITAKYHLGVSFEEP